MSDQAPKFDREVTSAGSESQNEGQETKTQPKAETLKTETAKMPQISLIEEVKEDCMAVQNDISFLKCKIYEKSTTPIVICQASVPGWDIPRLVLFVSSRYPNVGTVSFAFERPSAGWSGSLLEIRSAFRASAEVYSGQYGLDAMLRAWASAILDVLGRVQKD